MSSTDSGASAYLVADCLADAIARLTGAVIGPPWDENRWRTAVIAAHAYMADHRITSADTTPRLVSQVHSGTARVSEDNIDHHNLADGPTIAVDVLGAGVILGLTASQADYPEDRRVWGPVLSPDAAQAIGEALIRCADAARARRPPSADSPA